MSGLGQTAQLAMMRQCLMCGRFFMTVVDEYPLAQYRRKKGRVAEAEHIREVHATRTDAAAHPLIEELQCPTCTSVGAYGTVYLDWLDSREPSVTVLCRTPIFEDDANLPPGITPRDTIPLYRNVAGVGIKPKFQLVEGIGPAALEVDRSHSNTLYAKSCLQGCGVDIDVIYQLELGCQAVYRPIIESVMGALADGGRVVDESAPERFDAYREWAKAQLAPHLPLYQAYEDGIDLAGLIDPYTFLDLDPDLDPSE